MGEEQSLFPDEVHHSLIEISEITVTEIIGLFERPLPPCMGKRPAISLPREVNPLWMTEFITHEIEVTVAAGCSCNDSDHLMESYTAIDYRVLGFSVHGEIHLLVHETEDKGLVTN